MATTVPNRSPLIVSPHLYLADVTGRPLDYGMVYFGEPNKDGEFYPINIFSDKELTEPLAQPVYTKGGFLHNNGDMVEVFAYEGVYSVKVLDQYGRKIFYKAEVAKQTIEDATSDVVDAAQAEINRRMTELDRSINAIGEAGAGANGWTDLLISTAMGRTQRDKNSDFVSAKDFGIVDSTSDQQISTALQRAKDNNFVVVFDFDATIKVPTHASNLQDAIRHVASLSRNQQFTILIEAGHQLTSGLYLKDGDWSNFTISSVDTEVSVSDNYTDPYILKAERAHAPVWNTIVNGKHLVFAMLDIQHNSTLTVLPRKGVRNPLSRGVYLNGSSKGYLNYLISTGATVGSAGRNLWVSRNSNCECGGAELDGAGDYNLWVSRGSNAYGESIKFSNSNFGAIGATRFSVAACNLATITNCGAVARSFGAHIYINDSKATGIKIGGIYAEETGTVSARNIEITADATSQTLEYGIKADSGAVVAASQSKIVGFKLSSVQANGGSTVNIDTATITGIGTGVLLDSRDGSTISAKSATVKNAAVAINARNLGRVVATSATMSGITSNTVYALNASTVDISLSNINSIASNNVAVYRGSTAVVQNLTVAGVAVAIADTNITGFGLWTANGAIFN